MGIAPSIAAFITNCCVALSRTAEDAGRCLTLGKQAVHISETQLYKILGTQGVISLTDDNQVVIPEWLAEARNRLAEQDSVLATIPELRQRGEISDLMFFEGIGFTNVHSVDASAYEGADFVHDLNQPGLSDIVDGPYDMVFDIGTMEHIFNVPNVLKNIFDVVKVGGSVIHVSPANNVVDHGYYQFSPMLFHEYYAANQYKIVRCMFTEESAKEDFGEPIQFYPYQPSLAGTPLKSSEKATYGTAICVQKSEVSTGDTIPQQSSYENQWNNQ